MFSHLTVLLASLLFTLSAAAQTASTQAEEHPFTLLRSELSVWSTHNDSFSMEQVRSLPDSVWEPVRNPNMLFGLSSEVRWLRLDWVQPDSIASSYRLEVVNPHLREFKVHQFRNGVFERSDTLGTRFPFEHRSIPHRNFLIPIEAQASDSLLIYLGILPSTSPANLNLLWWEAVYHQDTHRNLENSMITSFFLLCLLYLIISGLVIASAKLPHFWFYFAYILLGTLYVFTDLGLSFKYFWPNSPYLQAISIPVLSLLYMLAGATFITRYFQTSAFYPSHHRMFKALIVSAVVILIPTLFLPKLSVAWAQSLMTVQYGLYLLVCVFFFSLLTRSLWRGRQRMVYWFLMAFSLHGLSIIAMALQYLGFLPGISINSLGADLGYPIPFFTSVAMMAGMLIEMSLFFVILLKQLTHLYEDHTQTLRDLARQREQNMRTLVLGIEAERQRIAQDLHDSVGVMLSAVKMRLQTLEGSEDKQLRNIIKDLDKANEEVRSISHNLMPRALHKLGLEAAISELLQRLQLNSNGLQIQFYHQIQLKEIDPLAKIHLFRIVMEMVNNVLKHAKASRLDIQIIQHEKSVSISAEDDGKGFNVAAALNQNKSIGLRNIQQRTQALGGTLNLDSAPGRGTLVSVDIPLENILPQS